MCIDLKRYENLTESNNILVEAAQSFIEWKDKLHKEIRNGRLMFDVPKHYKWLDESELFTYYMDSNFGCYYQ